jgi:putative transposase
MQKWPHAPAHLKKGVGVYFVTASTLNKELFFKGDESLELLTSSLIETSEEYGWALQAWAVFPNHYHFVAQSPSESGNLAPMIRKLHANTARELNKKENAPGRKVWFQYRDTPLTFERSYFARLKYTHFNAVKHGVAAKADDYRWCSAAWFLRTADLPLIETVESFPIDRLVIDDDF